MVGGCRTSGVLESKYCIFEFQTSFMKPLLWQHWRTRCEPLLRNNSVSAWEKKRKMWSWPRRLILTIQHREPAQVRPTQSIQLGPCALTEAFKAPNAYFKDLLFLRTDDSLKQGVCSHLTQPILSLQQVKHYWDPKYREGGHLCCLHFLSLSHSRLCHWKIREGNTSGWSLWDE